MKKDLKSVLPNLSGSEKIGSLLGKRIKDAGIDTIVLIVEEESTMDVLRHLLIQSGKKG